MNKDLKYSTFPKLEESFKIHPNLQASLAYCLVKSAQLIRNEMDICLEEYNLCTAHVGILNVLFYSPTQNQIELGSHLGIDKATMVKLIDGLEELKFLERSIDPEDRRAKIITITKEGRKLSEKLSKLRFEIEEEYLADFDKKEREQIRKILPLILKSFYNANKKKK
jgi:DNA-binding MarR family transcriptional regulator